MSLHVCDCVRECLRERMKNRKMWVDGAKGKGQRTLRIRVPK
jgi:hypothetical protein